MLKRQLLIVAVTAALSSFITRQLTLVDEPEVSTTADGSAPISETPTKECSEAASTYVVASAKYKEPRSRQQPSLNMEKGDIASPSESSHFVLAAERVQHESAAAFDEFMETRRYSGSSQREIIASVEQNFQNEQLDYQWADRTESSILQLFENNVELSAISPLTVTCKSINCQVVLPVTDQSQISALSSSFSTIATAHDLGMKNPSVSFMADESTGRLIFYLSDNSNTELFR